MKSTNPRLLTKGFTLMELMVAMAITSIIVTVLVSITGTAIDTWSRSRMELRAARQAKAMVDVMANDFESLVTRSGGDDEWLTADYGDPEGGSTNAANIAFFTAATDRYDGQIGVVGVDNGGDVSCVGYQLQWSEPVPSEGTKPFNTFVLRRHLVDPDKTFNKLLGKTADKALATLFNTEFGSQLSESASYVCENIFQFTLVFHVESYTSSGDLNNLLVTIMDDTEFRIKGNGLETEDTATHKDGSSYNADNDPLQGGRVTAVEVSLSVVTDRGMSELRAKPSSTDDAKWLKENIYNYSKLIQLPRM